MITSGNFPYFGGKEGGGEQELCRQVLTNNGTNMTKDFKIGLAISSGLYIGGSKIPEIPLFEPVTECSWISTLFTHNQLLYQPERR